MPGLGDEAQDTVLSGQVHLHTMNLEGRTNEGSGMPTALSLLGTQASYKLLTTKSQVVSAPDASAA